jgi:hypothetical protein
LKRTGYGKGAKRRVLKSVKHVTKNTPTISDRQRAQLQIQERLGKSVSRETYRKLVQSGQVKRTILSKTAGDARFIRQYLPDVAPRHLAVMLKWYAGGWNGLDNRERAIFRSIYRQYSRDDVRQALGSAPQDSGSYTIAA